MAVWLNTRMGSAERVYEVRCLPLLVNAASLAAHVAPNRSEYLPLLFDAIEKPCEVWLAFERHQGTGKVESRARRVRAFALDAERIALVVAQARLGMLEAWTLIPMSKTRAGYVTNQRNGMLYYGRE